MKRLASAFCLILAVAALAAGTPVPEELTGLKAGYDRLLDEAAAREADRLASLRKDYFAALFELQDLRMASNDFTGVLAIKTELERFEFKQEISPEQKELMFKELRALRERYETSRAQIASDREKAAAEGRAAYVANLQALEKKLIAGGDTAGAAEVQAEVDTIQGAAKAAPASYLPGKFALRAYIDGADHIHVQGHRLWYIHEAGPFPGKSEGRSEPTYINGTAWSPSWNGYETRPFDRIRPPLRVPANKRVYVTRKFGRGEVILLEQPVTTNNFTLKILIDDRMHQGADWYEVLVKW